MKSLLIIAATVALASIGQAAETGAAATTAAPAQPAAAAAAPAAQPAAPVHAKGKHAAVSKETIKKCKAEHKGDKKAYMECLKAAN